MLVFTRGVGIIFALNFNTSDSNFNFDIRQLKGVHIHVVRAPSSRRLVARCVMCLQDGGAAQCHFADTSEPTSFRGPW